MGLCKPFHGSLQTPKKSKAYWDYDLSDTNSSELLAFLIKKQYMIMVKKIKQKGPSKK
jgi:hypothetical protein